MATIRDVARESGVSVATVSYVLNNGPRQVRAETRQRVLEVMHRLDYHPNAMARGLVRRRMHTLGVLFGQVEPAVVTNPYAAAVLQGILTSCADLGYNVTLFPRAWQNTRDSVAPFRDRRTDGVLVVAPLTGSDVVSSLASFGLPLVVISSPSPVPGVPSIDIDNKRGARLAVEHLIGLGHTRIAHIAGDETHASVSKRRQGFLSTLMEAGLSAPEEYLISSHYSREHSLPIARRLLSQKQRPTAIFAGNDMIAVAVLEAARELDILVPEELSVVGFDDLPMASHVTPQLTTVRQPLAVLGERATRLLVQRIEGHTSETGEAFSDSQKLEEPDLVIRGTTAPPPPSL